MQLIKSFLDDGDGGIGTPKGTPEYQVVRGIVEKLGES